MIAKVHKPSKVSADPFHGRYELTVGGKAAVVEYEPDSDLRDTEQVPLLEEGGIEAFIRREVLPYAPDAWVKEDATKIGYEVSFTRHFYKPLPLRTLEEISADILAAEREAEGLLDGLLAFGWLVEGGRWSPCMIADLKPYAEYKESGSKWLGKVPSQWEAVPLGRLLIQRIEQNRPVKTQEILSLSLRQGVIPYSEKKSGGNKAKDDLSAYTLAYPGDIVLNSMNVVVGSVGLSKYFGAVSPVYYVLHTRRERDSIHYFDGLFQDKTFQQSLWGLGNGIMFLQSKTTGKFNTIRMRIPMHALRRVIVPHPSPEEQATIVRFLDWANGRLERAIRAKLKVVALLNGQKQAIIHRTVTAGLDNSVNLKPACLPWLTSIPKHWEVRPLKQLLARMDYGTSENVRGEGRVRVLTMGHIRDGRVDIPPKGGLSSVPPGLLLEHNDLLFNRTNSPELVGKVGLFLGHAGDEITFASYLVRLRVLSKHNPLWLNYVLNSTVFWSYARSQALLSLHQANLNSKRYGQMALPVPPTREEQNAIVEHIRSEVGTIECAVSRQEREIELLREYRNRLLADVVTGKLDVRVAATMLPQETEHAPIERDIESSMDTEPAEEEVAL